MGKPRGFAPNPTRGLRPLDPQTDSLFPIPAGLPGVSKCSLRLPYIVTRRVVCQSLGAGTVVDEGRTWQLPGNIANQKPKPALKTGLASWTLLAMVSWLAEKLRVLLRLRPQLRSGPNAPVKEQFVLLRLHQEILVGAT
jgi:hypothetical protein